MKERNRFAGMFKVRIRLSHVCRGWWRACYVVDCAPATDGCLQRPVPNLMGAYGDTPHEAYYNLINGHTS